MSFRLPAILWAFALLAAAMATFGSLGILAAIGVVLYWTAVFHKRTTTILQWSLIPVISLFLAAIITRPFAPPFDIGRGAFRHTRCLKNVHELAAALMRFTQRRGAFPAAATANAEGRPPRSWRLTIIPQLVNYHGLFDQYHHDEPWDSAWNLTLAHATPEIYNCPADVQTSMDRSHTNYFAVVGPQTAWPHDRGRALSEIKDEPAKTILLIEVVGQDRPWTQPRDLTFDEAVALLTGNVSGAAKHHRVFRGDGIFYKPPPTSGASIAFANGSAHFVALPMSKELAVALLTVDGGEVVDDREFNRLTQPQLDYALCYALGAFVLLALLPAARFFRKTTKSAAPPFTDSVAI